MKNLKKLLGLVIISVVAFVAIGNVDAASDNTCGTGHNQLCRVHAVIDNSKVRNESGKYTDLQAVQYEINSLLAANEDIYSIKIELLEDDNTTLGNITGDTLVTDKPSGASGGTGLDIPVTIDLAGHKMTVFAAFNVLEDGSLTIMNSDNSKTGAVDAGSASINIVTVNKGGSFTSTGNIDYTGNQATFVKTTNVGSGRAKATINSGANVTTKVGLQIAGLDADVAVDADFKTHDFAIEVLNNSTTRNASNVSINAGTYESTNNSAVVVRGYANVTIKDGEFVSSTNTDNTVAVLGDTNMAINGGEFTNQAKNANNGTGYALKLAGKGVKINGGEFTSGAQGTKDMPAVLITTPVTLEDYKNTISAGTFNYGLVELSGLTTGGAGIPDVDNTIKDLILTTSSYTEDEDNGTVVVKNGATTQDPSTGDDQKPAEEGKPGPGDVTVDESPKTFDAIGSLVTMAISSLGVVGTATKKVLK